MKNLKEIKTTFIGLVFGVVGVLFFMNQGEELTRNDLIFLAVCGAGFIGFLTSPDKILDVFFGWIKRKK